MIDERLRTRLVTVEQVCISLEIVIATLKMTSSPADELAGLKSVDGLASSLLEALTDVAPLLAQALAAAGSVSK